MAGRVAVDGATSVVTGSGSGIGRAIALRLASRGGRIAVVDLVAAAAEKTAAECAELGGEAEAFACDVTDVVAVNNLAIDVGQRFGPVDVLVNNAGVGLTGRFLDTTLDDWHWIRNVNLDGILHCCHAFGPGLVERGRGHVVNVSSGLGYTPRATEPLYVATKAAILALSLCLRADWAAHGVGVSAVCPGVINTPIAQNTRYVGTRDESRERIEKLFKRAHPPVKVAKAVVRAVERDTAVVPVGFEAHVGWWFHRLAPVRAQQRLARTDLM